MDPDVFAARLASVMSRHGLAFVARARQAAPDTDAADDLMSEMLESICRSAADLPDDEEILRRTMLLSLRHRAIDAHRRRSHIADRVEIPETLAPAEPMGIDTVLRLAIESLPEKRRRAIELRYVDDLPVEAVARELGVSANTAKTHLRLGLAEIRERLVCPDRD